MRKRFEDWPERLDAFIERRRDNPFCWGTQDCSLLAADAIVEMTGEDPARELRGYTSALGALRRLGGKWENLRTLPDKLSFRRRAGVALAQRGDLVCIVDRDRYALAICLGGEVAAAGARGIEIRAMSAAVAAWET